MTNDNVSRKEKFLKLIAYINHFNPKPTVDSPEYLLLDAYGDDLTDEMLDALFYLKVGEPTYIDRYAEMLGKSVEDTAKLVFQMVKLGLAEYNRDENGVDRVSLNLFVPGSFELMLMEREWPESHSVASYAFMKYIQDLTEGATMYFAQGHGFNKAIPTAKSITSEPKQVAIEQVTDWIDKYYPSLSCAPCQCRKARRINGDLGHDIEGEYCIQLGEFAESCIRAGKSRRITREEARAIVDDAEKKGYVHIYTNMYGKDKSIFICNCYWSSCAGMLSTWYSSTPNMASNNFRSVVDKDKCVACGQCVEVCPVNAVKLGQKLCEKNPIQIKPTIIAGDPEYGENAWKKDFMTERAYIVPETGSAPCKTACPAHIAVQGYIRLASQGKYKEALELIKKENPLPAVCGAICNHRCEDACTRGLIDEPVAIDDIKKFIAEQELNAQSRFVPEKEFKEGKRIAVIGSGPAGLSCAYYLAVLGHDVTVFEKEKKLGGMLTLGIPSFRLEKDIIEAEIQTLRDLGVKFITGAEIGHWRTIAELRMEGYEGFYIAIGAQGGRKLGIEGEDAEGVFSGIDFLKKVNSGQRISLAGKTVVIGGGNVALDVARTAVRLDTSSVEMFCLESEDEMPASREELEDTLKEGITVNNGWGPKRILVKDGRVCGVEFKRCVAVFDENHKFAPKYDENDTRTVECEHVLSAIGQTIEWGNLLEGTAVELNKNGTAKTVPVQDITTFNAAPEKTGPIPYHLRTPYEVYQTAEPDIFVGGDVYSGPKFAIDAIAAGKEAAESLHRFVWKGHSLVLGRQRRLMRELDKDNAVLSGYDETPRQRPIIRAADVHGFHDPRVTLTEEQIKRETARCLGCGVAVVDQRMCIGCGLCSTRCMFDAIKLEKKYEKWGITYNELLDELDERMAKNIQG